ncbi:unnamed protein product [Arctia plantaginis]|nr:unnamed protein product [Arctia plantaginis]
MWRGGVRAAGWWAREAVWNWSDARAGQSLAAAGSDAPLATARQSPLSARAASPPLVCVSSTLIDDRTSLSTYRTHTRHTR